MLVFRSIATSFGPSLTIAPIAGAAGSTTQSRSCASATTLCTQTKWSFAVTSSFLALRHAFQVSSGKGTTWPSFNSATETAESSVHRGKLTKMRPSFETVTPVT